MSDPVDVPLGTATLVRKWRLEVNTGTDAVPVWTKVYGIQNFQPTLNPGLQDDSDYDSQGYGSQAVTKLDWSAVATVLRKTQASDPTAYDPGQEAIRLASLNLGDTNNIGVRFCELGSARVEAYQGKAACQWSPAGGAMDALDTVQVTLTGRGKRTPITHPYPATPVAPTITSLAPTSTAAAGGGVVRINGSAFTGATAVTVAGTPLAATAWTLIADNLIVFDAPAHAAGSATVTVTTPAGTSAAATLTYV